ncbi:hypothetical protein [Streptomyces chartreusis]|uniref:hypothetical protein n=1 Tax=Streptomyces chartreusis TaxID=1969 RepID=UPI0035D92F4C
MSGKIKTTIAASAITVLSGLAAILHSITRDDLPRAIGGLSLTVIGLVAIVLIVIRRTFMDSREERRRLAEALSDAHSMKSRHLTAQAAMECEQVRLRRDLDAERRAMTVRLAAEREAMAREFEERRAADIAETMEATVRMFQGGKFAPGTNGNLIRFPKQHPQHQPERARSREHGVVGP